MSATIIRFPSAQQRADRKQPDALPEPMPATTLDPDRLARLQAYAEMIRISRIEEDAGIRYPA
jgi:hypothetical protein